MKPIRFKDFLTLQRGFDLPKKHRKDGPFPIVAATGINGFHSEHKVDPPGVTTGRSGSLGQVVFIDEPFWPLNTALWVRDFKGNDPRYVYYFLQTLGLERYNSGAGVPTLNRNHLNELKIVIHDEREQRTISQILGDYDDLIANNLRRIEILEEMAQLIYREWFVHLRYPLLDNDGNITGHADPDEMTPIDSPLGPIPEGWSVESLESVCSHIFDHRGKTPKKLGGDWGEEGILALSAKNIKNGRLINLEKAKWIDEGLYRIWMKEELAPRDILMTSEAPMGQLKFLGREFRYCLSQRLFGLRANVEIIGAAFLYRYLSSGRAQAEMQKHATGSTVLGIRQAALRTLPVLTPDNATQRYADEVFTNIEALLDCLCLQNRCLREARDLLLPRLISGELDVSELDIELPEEAAV